MSVRWKMKMELQVFDGVGINVRLLNLSGKMV
jgi:hypothetical protein